MDRPRPHDGIGRIVPYVPGWSKLPNVAKTYRLASNESALGASPKALAAASDALKAAGLYPNPPSRPLRAALARHYEVDERKIFIGAGSEDIIRLLACAYATTGDDIVYTQHGFLAYPISARVAGADTIVASESELTVDVDALASAVTTNTKVVFIANPGNPTGTYVSRDALDELRKRLPPQVLLVVDSAYAEFVERGDYDPGFRLVDRSDDNVVMLRTFSKAYGLAALRVGWAYGPESVIGTLDKARNQFNVTGPGQAAALAALQDGEHLKKVVGYNATNKRWLEARLRELGMELSASVANFVLARCPGGTAECERLDAWLRERGVSVKPGDISGLPEWLRITVGPKDALEALVEAMRSFYANDDG